MGKSERRTKSVTTKVTQAEYGRLVETAAANGLNLSEWVRGPLLAPAAAGLAGNYALYNNGLNRDSVAGMIPDPAFFSNFMHGGYSWYDWSLVGTGHVASYQGNVESQFDSFSPIFLTPLHFLFDVFPSLFINPKPGITGPTYICSPGAGCHR